MGTLGSPWWDKAFTSNEIHLDTTGSNINITAPETMTFNAKNMSFTAGENVTITAGMNITSNAGMNISETAGLNHSSFAGAMMNQNAVLDYSLMASNIMNIASENFSYEATDIHKNAAEGIEVAASKDYVQNSEQTVHNLSGEKGHNA